tara:strand:+ start:23 stop:274 length:252 start_codon:yes stop_codon:yes gene_type:complete
MDTIEKLNAKKTYEQFHKALNAITATGREFVLIINSENDPDGFAAIYGDAPFLEASIDSLHEIKEKKDTGDNVFLAVRKSEAK